MKDTNEPEKKENKEKPNFQALRKHFFTYSGCSDFRKCDSYISYDELVRIWRAHGKSSCAKYNRYKFSRS